MKKTLLLVLSAMLLSFSAQAVNRYVSTMGDDSNDGKSWTTARATIESALYSAEVGDTVFVAAGTYNQMFSIQDGKHVFGGYDPKSGLRSTEAFATVLDGTDLSKFLIVKYDKGCDNLTVIDGITLQNAAHSNEGGAGFIRQNCVVNNCIIRNCVTSSSAGAFYNNGGVISNCIIELCEAGSSGGAIYNKEGGIVEYCIIRGNKGKYGAVRNTGNSIVRNCLIHNNEASVSGWPNSGGIYNEAGEVYNNTVVCNWGSQYAGVHSNGTAYNNVFWSNKSEDGFTDPANFIGQSTTSGDNAVDFGFDGESFSVILASENTAATGPNFIAPTLFVGAPKNAGEIAAMRAANFKLLATSPLVDKGRAVEGLITDLAHGVRPIGAGIDLGCYEYNSNVSSVEVTGVMLNTDSAHVYVGDTTLVVAILLPADATNRKVKWSVADATIASVEGGAIVGLKVGETTVTATTEEGNFTATTKVVVEEKPIVIIHPEVLAADTLYAVEDYMIPSYIPFLIAKEAARTDSTPENIAALRTKISELKSYKYPYNVVVNINGDPRSKMAFAWFTNEKMTDGVVQLVAKSMADVTEADFASAIEVKASHTITKPLPYAVSTSGILKAAKMSSKQKYTYVSHKAIATGLTPNTTYTYRVGVDGYWSELGTFTTAPEKEEEFTFVYMTDSHVQDQKYVDEAKKAAVAAAKNVPEAKFMVFTGDMVETGTEQNSEWEWERWFDEAMRPMLKNMPVVPTDGNHEDTQNQNYSYHFNTDNTFKENAVTKPQFDGITYSFMYGDVLFLVFSMQDYWRAQDTNKETLVCSYLTHDVGNWFRGQVEAHPEAKLRVALVHKNIFSGSGHQEDSETPLYRATMLPIMKECGIDVVLQGHDHCYEVIGPVDADTRKPIMAAISDREQVSSSVSMSGYKGGTYNVEDGTLYFIGATCGEKRYWPYTKKEMEDYYPKHKVENYFDLFTGMFCQPGAPSYSTFTVKDNTITVKSYTADANGNSTLFNTFKIVRGAETDDPTTGVEQVDMQELINANTTGKVLHNGQVLIIREGVAYDLFGRMVK